VRIPKRGGFYTHIEIIDLRKLMKLPINVQKLPLDVQAYEGSAEENHSEVGGDGSKLPPCRERPDEIT
jgi:hypothetical protein